MSILVVGSVAFDSLETPAGRRERVLGGDQGFLLSDVGSQVDEGVGLFPDAGEELALDAEAWKPSVGLFDRFRKPEADLTDCLMNVPQMSILLPRGR